MRKIFISILLTLNLLGSITAQYTPQSPWFQNPDLMKDFAADCADFWAQVHDDTYGGFFVDVGRSGNVLNNSTKAIVSESRDAYGFARAFMLTGNTDYLDHSRSALDFMYDHLWDDLYGGWFRRCNRNGTGQYSGNKTAFDQHYALLGVTAYYEATGNEQDLNMLDQAYQFNEDYLWDDSPQYFGYYNEVSRTGFGANGKSFNATVDAITTHLYNLYLMTGEQKYMDRLLQMKSNIIDYLVASMPQQSIGFAEEFQTNWTIDNSQQRTIMGHVLKTGWCLGRIYQIAPDNESLDAAQALVQDVLDKGYDHEFGGPYKDYDRSTGQMYMYGAIDTAKAWWQMEQAITAGLVLYDITGENKYIEMADESLDFFMNYFVDPTYGEIYADRARDGGRVYTNGGYWDENKGSEWKAAYHSIETAYYAYLYGKLLVQNDAATLYYKYDPAPQQRIFNMTPLALDFSKLTIQSVTKDGTDYTLFNPTERTLTLAANEGGLFAVTYQYTGGPSDISEDPLSSISLLSNYPNPFSDQTTISFSLKKDADITIRIYNSYGHDQIENGGLSKGSHQIRWVPENLASGTYFYQLSNGSHTLTGKCFLLK